jgi:hypothetical protein
MSTRLPHRSNHFLAVCVLVIVVCFLETLNAATYYVDSVNGNDAADGQSETTAWRTNARVNQTAYQPGDRIFYKRGGVYPGHLHPSGSGVAGNPITLSAYGEGARPIIDGEGNSMPVGSTTAYLYMDINVNYGGSAMSFRSQEYWEISGIAVRNKGASEAIRRGLFISLGGATYRGWKIRDCAFHDINGWNQDEVQQGKSLSGVTLLTTGTTEGFLLEDNEFYGIAGGAMWIACGKGGGVENKPYWGAGLVVRGNVIRDIGTMGMLITRAKDPLIEHNVAYRCHKRSAAGGLWNANTEGAVFQFNEWYDDGKDGQDGTAFDPDVYTTKTTVQYNYVHDAQGLICFYTDEKPVDPDIIRYNVCVNLHTGGSGIVRFKADHPIHVYNNTFYITSYAASGGKKAFEGFSGLASQDHRFYNNLVFIAPTASNFAYGDGLRNAPASKVSHNCFAGEQVGSVPVGDTVNTLRGVDPLLVSPGPSDPGFATCVNYQLQAGSPCIDAGKVIAGNGGRDFFGNPLADGSPDIGFHEFTAAPEDYAAWAAVQNWGSLPASEREPGADPDGDGIINALERAFGTDPVVPDSPSQPLTAFELVPDGSCLVTMIFRKAVAAGSYIPWVSFDLDLWNEITTFTESYDSASGLTTITFTLPAPVGPKVFSRLRYSD